MLVCNRIRSVFCAIVAEQILPFPVIVFFRSETIPSENDYIYEIQIFVSTSFEYLHFIEKSSFQNRIFNDGFELPENSAWPVRANERLTFSSKKNYRCSENGSLKLLVI